MKQKLIPVSMAMVFGVIFSLQAATNLFPAGVGNIDPEGVVLTWENNSTTTNELRFKVYLDPDGKSLKSQVAYIHATTNSITLPFILEPNTTYNWRVDDCNGNGSVFDYDLKTERREGKGASTNFWTSAGNPWRARSPVPSTGITDMMSERGNILQWSGLSATGVSYKVYFGKDCTPDDSEWRGNLTNCSFSAGILEPGVKYYWRIDAVTADGATVTGCVWNFRTGIDSVIYIETNTLIFADNFEIAPTGALPFQWRNHNSHVQIRSISGYPGKCVKISYTNWIEKKLSTWNMSNIQISYQRLLSGYTNYGGSLTCEWSKDRTNWTPLISEQTGNFADPRTAVRCSRQADNRPDFWIRFRTDSSSASAYAYLDDVKITGVYSPVLPERDPEYHDIVGATVIFLGDSLTSDNGNKAYHWTAALTQLFDLNVLSAYALDTNGRPIRVHTHGKGGSRAYEGDGYTNLTPNAITHSIINHGSDAANWELGGYQRLKYAFAEADAHTNNMVIPEFVIINFGMNDHKRECPGGINTEMSTPDDFANHLEMIINLVRSRGARPVLVTPHDFYQGPGDGIDCESYYRDRDPELFNRAEDNYSAVGRFHLFIDEMRKIADKMKVDLIDVNKAASEYDENEFTLDGGVHLEELGHDVYALSIGDYLNARYWGNQDLALDPRRVLDPTPTDLWRKTDVNAALSWSPADGAVAYHIYFGTNVDLNASTFRGTQTETTYIPGSLSPNTKYYWRIDWVDSSGNIVTGEVWRFFTVSQIPGANSLLDMLSASPNNYYVRDWKSVAMQYVGLVTNTADISGPGFTNAWTAWEHNIRQLNYEVELPRIKSYVGGQKGGDALNLMPTVIAAKLMGKELGSNWVNATMHFQGCCANRETLSNITYKEKSTGFWYEVLPSLYFNQLVDLYSESLSTNEIAYKDQPLMSAYYIGQSNSMEQIMYQSSCRWYECCRDYLRTTNPASDYLDKIYCTVGFNTVTGERSFRGDTNSTGVITNYTHDGVWECAAGLAWIQYTAYKKFGNGNDINFLHGAEWALRFMDQTPKNPMHNGIQMGYGALTMARMNAELGYNWDVDQMFRWIFGEGANDKKADISDDDDDNAGPARAGWGLLYSNFGPYEISGLIGSEGARGGANRAYSKQGYNLAGSLAPLVRYDSRYALPVGKWLLHLASSSRNFYQTYLDDQHRDSPFFNGDPNGVIPFESLRGYHTASYFQQYIDKLDGENSYTPNAIIRERAVQALSNPPPMWASGVYGVMQGGLGLCLYFGGDVGYLGAIVSTNTAQDKILQIDLLATDFFHDAAYPTYLYYNPYSDSKSIRINVGTNSVKVYDTATHKFITGEVTGSQTIDVPANGARVLVLTPAGGQVGHDGRKLLVDGIVVDYYYPVKSRIFSDGFESGDLVLGGWTSGNTSAEVKSEGHHTGSYGVKLYKTTWIEKAVSTVGYSGIYVKYRRATEGYDVGDKLYVEWSVDGTNWNNLETVQNGDFTDGLKNMRCLGADNNPGFRIRFKTNATENGETAYVDDIEVVASY